jgi:hypothetical protein
MGAYAVLLNGALGVPRIFPNFKHARGLRRDAFGAQRSLLVAALFRLYQAERGPWLNLRPPLQLHGLT